MALTRVTGLGVNVTPVLDINLTTTPTPNLSPVMVNVTLPPAALSTEVGLTLDIPGGLSIATQSAPL